MNINDPATVHTARLLATRLERLSADSYWAHQASGLRGSLLRCLDDWDKISNDTTAPSAVLLLRFEKLNRRGFEILVHAAREIRSPRAR